MALFGYPLHPRPVTSPADRSSVQSLEILQRARPALQGGRGRGKMTEKPDFSARAGPFFGLLGAMSTFYSHVPDGPVTMQRDRGPATGGRGLASYPQEVIQAAHALRRPVAEVTAENVESWGPHEHSLMARL